MPDTSVLPSRSNPNSIPFVSRLVATGFFTGYIPFASGTIGSIVGILIYLIPGMENPFILIPLIILGTLIGAVTGRQVAAIVGNQQHASAAAAKALFRTGDHASPDPSIVVVDEIVGMWVSLVFLPKTIWPIFIAFVAFRVFDTIKPPPARGVERLGAGWGIMLDDIVAGVYAAVLTNIIIFLVPGIVG